MSDGMSTWYWWALDNLPPADMWHHRGRAPEAETLARVTQRNRDLETVIRDQQRHIASLEAQLLPHLLNAAPEPAQAILGDTG